MLLAVLAGVLGIVTLAQAQDQGNRDRNRDGGRDGGRDQRDGGRNGGRDRGNFDPAAMRDRWMNSIKEDLGAKDDEWKVLQPKVEKVMTARRETMGDRGFGGFRRGGDDRRGGEDRRPPSDQPESKVAKAQRDLRTALDNKSASSDEINKKLTAYREARDKARADLQAAQKDLKELCTPRQEAALVMNGMLE
jgi:hypothetical protein